MSLLLLFPNQQETFLGKVPNCFKLSVEIKNIYRVDVVSVTDYTLTPTSKTDYTIEVQGVC